MVYEIQNKEYFNKIKNEIAGLEDGFFYYCPVCGNVSGNLWLGNKVLECGHCLQTVMFKRSKKPWIYYADVAVSKYGTHANEYVHKVLFDEEASKNPEFDQDMHDFKMTDKQLKDHIHRILQSNSDKNVPKCPTCGSTNIESISFSKRATHTVLFGLASKTARSQFSCKNCGYKW